MKLKYLLLLPVITGILLGGNQLWNWKIDARVQKSAEKKLGFDGEVSRPFNLVTDSTSTPATTTNFFGTVRPSSDASFDLGSTSLRWRNIYLAGSLLGGPASSVSSTNILATNVTTTNLAVTNQFSLPGAAFALETVNISDGAHTQTTSILSDRVGINSSTSQASLGVQGKGSLNPVLVASSSGASMLSLLTNGRFGLNSSSPIGSISLVTTASVDPIRVLTSTAGGAQILALKANGQFVVGPNSLAQAGQIAVEHQTTNNIALSFTNGSDYTAGLGRVQSGLMYVGGPNGTSLALQSHAINMMHLIGTTRNTGVNSSSPNGTLAITGFGANAALIVASSSNAYMFNVLANGNVGVNSSTPSSQFVVQGGTSTFESKIAALNGAYGSAAFTFYNDGQSGMYLNSAGQLALTGGFGGVFLALGSFAPQGANDMDLGKLGTAWRHTFTSGTVVFSGLGANVATDDFVCYSATGTLQFETANCTVSSARFKENINSLSSREMLNKVRQLRAVSFDWKEGKIPDHGINGGGKESTGFIAEEVALIDPMLVVYTNEYSPSDLAFVEKNYPKSVLYKNGKTLIPKTVDYARVSVLLSGAVQSLDERLNELENKTVIRYSFWDWFRSLFN